MKASRLFSTQEALEFDVIARTKWGISTLQLMENAGRQVADAVKAVLKRRQVKTVAIICGKGNNGGDGFVAARHLLAQGIKPDVYLVGTLSHIKEEARVNAAILLKLNHGIKEVKEKTLAAFKRKVPSYGLVVDALLGVGLRGEVRGMYAEVIRAMNAADTYVLAVDIPSGLEATTGDTVGCCVRADATVTFVAIKRGMAVRNGPSVCGRVLVRDIGAPLGL